MTYRWEPDFLGPEYKSCTLDLGEDAEGEVVATLVRLLPAVPVATSPIAHWLEDLPWANVFRADPAQHQWRPRSPGAASSTSPSVSDVVLYLPGWADYFFQTELAEAVVETGAGFYALELRKYGRSLRAGQTAGFIESLTEYDADIAAALEAIRSEHGQAVRVHLLGHSLGGLIAALWSERHHGELATLILNAPWLELQGSSLVRQIAGVVVYPFLRRDPHTIIQLPEMSAYWESVSGEASGEWKLNEQWRPARSFPIRAAWVSAVLAGHAVVARGLKIAEPICVLLSARSKIQAVYSEEMSGVDAVIDVNVIARRSLHLGRRVSVFRYDGALHDVFLSKKPVRDIALKELQEWLVRHRL